MSRCPNADRCPMFPEFRNRAVLRIYQMHYCEAPIAYEKECARFAMMAAGVKPPPSLLPDGSRLEEMAP